MKSLNLTFLIIFFIFSCKNEKKNNKNIYQTEDDISIQEKAISEHFNSIGVVIFDNTINGNEKKFKLLNKDKTTYLYVSFPDEILKIDNAIFELYSNETVDDQYNFHPLNFYPETGEIIQFECIKKTDEYYYISVSNENNYKLLSVKNKVFKFLNWKKYIEDSFISPKDNYIYSEANKNSTKTNISANENSFQVEEFMENDWLKIKCIEECNGCQSLKDKFFYIKWRENNKILIDFYSLC